jgi:hypothetical protein
MSAMPEGFALARFIGPLAVPNVNRAEQPGPPLHVVREGKSKVESD